MDHILKKCGSTLLYCLLIFLLLSCNNKGSSTLLLTRAFELVETEPTEALLLLDSVKTTKGMSEDERMQLITIATYAQLKTDTHTSLDTLIYVAQDYFNANERCKEASIANYSAGLVRSKNNDVGKSVESFLNAYANAEQNEDRTLMAKCLHNIGFVYYTADMFDSASVYLEKAIILHEAIGSSSNLKMKTYKYLGETYDAMKQNTLASDAFSKGLGIAKRADNIQAEAIFNQNLAITHLANGEYRISANLSSLAMNQTDLETDTLKLYNLLSKAYLGMGMVDSDNYYSMLLDDRLGDITNAYTSKVVYQTLSRVAKNNNEYEKALYYRDMSDSAQAQIQASKHQLDIHKGTLEFYLNQKEKLGKYDKVKERFLWLAPISLLVFLVVLASYKWHIWRKKGLSWDNYIAEIKELRENKGINVLNIIPLTLRYISLLESSNLDKIEVEEDRERLKANINKEYISSITSPEKDNL